MKLNLFGLALLLFGSLATSDIDDISQGLIQARSKLLPRTKRTAPPQAKGPIRRKDIMWKGLPQLKRVNSAPSRIPDPQAWNLLQAENHAKKTRKIARQTDEVVTKVIGQRMSLHASDVNNPNMSPLAKYERAEGTAAINKLMVDDRKRLGETYQKAARVAAKAGRKDRVERNVKKANTNIAKAESTTAAGDIALNLAKGRYLPQIADAFQWAGSNGPDVERVRAQGLQAQRDTLDLATVAARKREKYRDLRQNGGKDTDSGSES